MTHKMNLQQLDSPESKDSHHPGIYLGYVSADHENLSLHNLGTRAFSIVYHALQREARSTSPSS